MIAQRSDRSRALPFYGYLGLAMMALGETMLFAGNRFFAVYFTPWQWTGYVLLLDALIARRRGSSLLTRAPGEFLLLALISIGSWLIFEGYNLLLHNWRYLGLPSNRAARYLGYGWSFATITPGILLTYDLITAYFPDRVEPPPVLRGTALGLTMALGFVCLVVPLLLPSPYMTPLVWIGFVLFLDPLNGRLGIRSFLAELAKGKPRGMLQLFLAGLVCGLLWEFWNYWAQAKWKYNVPYWGEVKLFEMPLLGYLGFLPFAVECYALYKFIRKLLPIPTKENYLG